MKIFLKKLIIFLKIIKNYYNTIKQWYGIKMCGIYGYYSNNSDYFNKINNNLNNIKNALNHRGPDQSNIIILKEKYFNWKQ